MERMIFIYEITIYNNIFYIKSSTLQLFLSIIQEINN